MGKFSTWNLLSNLKTTSFQTHNVKRRAEMKNRPKVCNLVVSLPTQSPSGFWMFAINVCGKHAFLSNINIHFDRIPLENSYIRKLIENVLLDYLAAVVCGSVSVSRVCFFSRSFGPSELHFHVGCNDLQGHNLRHNRASFSEFIAFTQNIVRPLSIRMHFQPASYITTPRVAVYFSHCIFG